MPQFDISSFIVQLITLYFSLLCFYFLFSWKYLPSWAFLLKTRNISQKADGSPKLNYDNYYFSKPNDILGSSRSVEHKSESSSLTPLSSFQNDIIKLDKIIKLQQMVYEGEDNVKTVEEIKKFFSLVPGARDCVDEQDSLDRVEKRLNIKKKFKQSSGEEPASPLNDDQTSTP